jgi:hypothetical protein
MSRAYRERWATDARALGLLLVVSSLASCGSSSPAEPVSAEDVEIALYVAIQNDDPRVVVSGATDRSSLRLLLDISCREAALRTWACDVLLGDESRVSCTVDRIRGDDAEIDGRVHCKR